MLMPLFEDPAERPGPCETPKLVLTNHFDLHDRGL